MELTVNGESRCMPDGTSLLGCIRSLNVDEEAVVAELNGTIVSSNDFAATALSQGDVLELLHFVGGG